MSISIELKYTHLISHRLRNFKQKNNYLFNMSCPICGDSKTKLTKARGYIYQKGNNLYYRCHNCGASMSLGNFINHIDPYLYQEFIMERYKSGESGNSNFKSPAFNIPIPKFDKVEKQKVFEYAEWCDKLPTGHFCRSYLERRKIPNQYYNRLMFTSHYKKFCDALIPNHGKQLVDDARLVIPYYDEYNDLIAVSGRALETNDKTLRYITLRTQESENKLIYGMDRVDLKKPVKIVEGPIDSLFLSNCLASGDANLSIAAKNTNAANITLIFDRENRNRELCGLMEKAIKSNYCVVIWPDNLKGKDINEMVLNGYTTQQLEEIISNNTFSGLEAQLKFSYWNKI